MAKKKASKKSPSTTVKDCVFTGVVFDGDALEAIQTIAEGLVVTAQSLGSLAGVFKMHNIKIDTLLQVGTKETKPQ